jgi:hypothetical protein
VVVSKAADGSSFTIRTPMGTTLTVDVGRSTRYGLRLSGSATFSLLAVGDHVLVAGTVNGSSIAATSVTVVLAAPRRGYRGGFGPGGGAFGPRPGTVDTVSSVDAVDLAFTVTTSSGTTAIVQTNGSTAWSATGGGGAASFASLSVGERVAVTGTTSSTGALDASSVAILPAGAGAPGAPGAPGALNGGSSGAASGSAGGSTGNSGAGGAG